MPNPVPTLFVLASVLCCQAAAKDADYKLQPLAYNHPGLEVDLGVGLWAYPMPLDYDGDGDMDLLVGCPDKPSSGTYFFENASQDPTDKMPVFKPAVRIGNGYHYMMLSFVNDEPVVMTPNKAYRRDSSTNQFDFRSPQKIELSSSVFPKSSGRIRGRMWRYADYDGDGDHDLIVGRGDWSDLGWDHAYDNHGNWRNGPLHGHVYVVKNSGSDLNPAYVTPAFRIQAAGGDVDVYGWPSPNLADFDGDGDLDLLCGEFLDGFNYFENIGSRTKPQYAACHKLKTANGEPLVMQLQMITPTATDWDGDGDLDLIVGDEDGRVAFVEHSHLDADGIPVFQEPAYFRQQADTLKFGALATPFAIDWDDDGDEDLLCGNTAGSIAFFENLGQTDDGDLRWAAPDLIEVQGEVGVQGEDGQARPFRVMAGPSGSIQGPCEAKWGYTTLSSADFDNDGDHDILFNSILAEVGMLRNDGGRFTEVDFDTGQQEQPPVWYWWQTQSSSMLTQWRTTPMAIDFDGDKTVDLVMLDQEGYLTLRRGGQHAERIFIDEDNQPLQLNAGTCGRSGRVKLAVVDWDSDGRLDVLVNSENATWYRNCEDRDGKIVLKKVGNLARRNVAGHTSSPTVCDFNQDGKPDLIVGSENGRIYHIDHNDCISYSGEQLIARTATTASTSLRDEFIFKNAQFESCHASTICETSRGLVAAWFGGTREGADDVAIWTSYHDGLKWSGPSRVADGIQHAGLRYPCWNPVLFQAPGDGPTMLFFKVGPNPRQWWGEVMVSYDRGRTFRERRRLPEGIAGPIRCRPILLEEDNSLLCGVSTEESGWQVHFERCSLLGGKLTTGWKRTESLSDPESLEAIQPTFLRHPSGRLQVLARTRAGVIATSSSNDRGKTWTPLKATSLPNPNASVAARTLSDGRHVLVYNDAGNRPNKNSGSRSRLVVAVSADGEAWTTAITLEDEGGSEFSYPSVMQSRDGRIHVSYTWKRERVKHVSFLPKEL